MSLPPDESDPKTSAGSPKSLRTFVAYLEDLPGVLNRVTSLFRRRAYNLTSVSAGRTHTPGVSRMTVVMDADDIAARLVEANLYKMVNVLRVEDVTYETHLIRELALVKIRCAPEQRPALLQTVEVFRGRVVDVSPGSIIVEVTGSQEKIDNLVELLRPHEILEMARTGAVAMTRSAQPLATRLHRVPPQPTSDENA